MARRGRRKAPGPIGSLRARDGWGALTEAFLERRRVRGFTDATVANYERQLRAFVAWCEERQIVRPCEVTRPILERYQRHLYYHRGEDGRALTFRTQHGRLVPVVQLFRWLTREHHLPANPASELELPKLGSTLPRAVLTIEEVERVLAMPDVATTLGVRDRAMLETFYSTGMRRMELAGLRLYDVSAGGGAVVIRQGKGKKDRVVPIGERALRWIDKYVTEVRPQLVMEPDGGTLYLTNAGEPFLVDALSRLARQYVDAAGLGKRGSTHLFRHTMATLMLEGGADIRFIQAMLGHARLTSTEIYTRVSIRKLKEVHERMHPGARLGRRSETTSETTSAVAGDAAAAAAALHESLAAEAAAEREDERELAAEPARFRGKRLAYRRHAHRPGPPAEKR